MMKKKSKNKQQEIREFDIARLLKSKRAITEYLNQVIAEGDDAELVAALGHIARAKRMTVISQSSGLTREALGLRMQFIPNPHHTITSRR
ncbi:MAG: putative addiction module antidote protein [Burkholderiaceae bacterium]|jgi:probable addiction module antidote protein|nr:putative addiction module antidote protein [Burkholderiaceae bacterium]